MPEILFNDGVHWFGPVNIPGVSFNALRTASAKFSTTSAAEFRIKHYEQQTISMSKRLARPISGPLIYCWQLVGPTMKGSRLSTLA